MSSCAHSADGLRTQMTVSGQSNPVTYTYDNGDRLSGIVAARQAYRSTMPWGKSAT